MCLFWFVCWLLAFMIKAVSDFSWKFWRVTLKNSLLDLSSFSFRDFSSCCHFKPVECVIFHIVKIPQYTFKFVVLL